RPTTASSACACGGYPVHATSSTSPPQCRISKRSRSEPLGLHRITRRRSVRWQCRRQRGVRPPQRRTLRKAVITNAHQAKRSLNQRLFQQHRPKGEELSVSRTSPVCPRKRTSDLPKILEPIASGQL